MGPTPAHRPPRYPYLASPALLAGVLTAVDSLLAVPCWAPAAGHPVPPWPRRARPQQHPAATWRGELIGRWQHDRTGLPGPSAAHGTATTAPRQRPGRGRHQTWCWLAVTWQREAAEPEGCQELDTEHDHAQHASLRYVLSSTRSRSQQSLTSAGSPRPSSARDDLSTRLGTQRLRLRSRLSTCACPECAQSRMAQMQ